VNVFFFTLTHPFARPKRTSGNKIHGQVIFKTMIQFPNHGREVPKEKHLTDKIFAQRIERNKLTLWTRIKRLARKSVSFSRPIEPRKVNDVFIEKYMFY